VRIKVQASFLFFVGIDWATENHQVCVLDREGEPVAERQVRHSGSGIQEFISWLGQHTGVPAEQVAVAIEMPSGAIIETLVEHNYQAFSLNPKQLDRFRDRHTVAGAKDDRRDAFVLADSLRTDLHCFHRIRLDAPEIIRIRTLSRLEDSLLQDWSRLTNQLREQLHRYFPQILELSAAADEVWVWDLLEAAPLPSLASKLKRQQVDKILSRRRIRRFTAEHIIEKFKAQALPVAPGTAEAASEACLLLIARLRLLAQQRKEVEQRIEQQLTGWGADPERTEHRDVQLLLSLPGIGRVVTATMLAEASQPLAERDYHALRSYAGVAPVTRQSGKRKRQVVMRYGCNQRLRNALYHWARVSLQKDSRSRDHYHRLRQKGHSHGRALRGVLDRLLAMLISILQHQHPYDPQRRQRQVTTT
jgi:transposase